MKKILLPLFAVAALLTACDEEQFEASQLQKGVTFTVPDFVEESGTRVAVSVDADGAHFTWTAGDTLGVFPENGYQTAFPISNGQGTSTAIFDGADWALRPNASYAAYYPMQHPMDAIDKTAITASYLGQAQNGNGSTAHIGAYDYLAAKYNTVSPSGDVNFTLNHLGCLVRFQLTMPKADAYTQMTLSCEEGMMTTKGKFNLTAATPTLTTKSQDVSISLALNNIETTAANQVLTLYMMLPPMDLSGKNLSIKVSGETDYTATVAGKDMKAGSIYGYSNTMVLPTLMHNGHEYVDLGLSVLWATCNVGASKPEEFGDYFAWGETKPKTTYDWSTYFDTSDEGNTFNKYNNDGGKTVLDPEDDAAAVNWGGNWRIPTLEEWYEHLPCRTESAIMNGVSGEMVTGKNGNSIFLPCADYQGLHENPTGGPVGFYWTSTLTTSDNSESNLFIVNWPGWSKRFYGFSVRPVCPNPNFIRVSSIQITGEKTQLAQSETLQLSATVTPSNATNASLKWLSSNPSVATVSADGLVTAVTAGSVTITATAKDGSGVKGKYAITAAAPALMHNGHEYVDLGLPSGLKWATCNVGATQPEEYGDYFAWGETEPYYTEGHAQDSPCSNWKSGKSNGYDWPSLKYCNGSYDTMIKYCESSYFGTVDNKTVLESADDAATANWGGSWRMPTSAEQQELNDNCTWTWTTLNGVKGYNVEGPKGNSIFLPAAGYRYDSSLNEANTCYYWSSSLYAFYSMYASYLKDRRWVYGNRCCGFSVRPVCQ